MFNKLRRLKRRLVWLFSIYLRKPHIATLKTKNGLLSFYSKDRILGRSLSVEREFEYDGMIKCVKLLTDNRHISDTEKGMLMDVGGYIGMIGIGFLTAKIFNKALMFEPNPDSFKLILKNIAQNKMQEDIQAFNIALSDVESELIMELSHKNYGDHRIRKEGEVQAGHYNEEERKTIKVRATPLDNFVNENETINYQDIKLVWMDVQGHEGKFIQGASEFFKKYKNVPVAMEFWPYGLLRSGTTKKEFCDVVKSLFTNFYILDDKKNEIYDINEVDKFFDSYSESPAGGCHLILLNV